MTPDDVLALYARIQAPLHALWTRAVDQPGYGKSEWCELSNAIDRLARSAATDAGLPADEPLLSLVARGAR